MTAVQVLIGALFAYLLFEQVRRTASLRRLLSRNLAALVGTTASGVGLALLMVVPITKYFSDAGRLWCGTYLNRSENWPAACDEWDLYEQRFDLARWPLLLGVVLIGAANVWSLSRKTRALPPESN
jgi:hypothetical protein